MVRNPPTPAAAQPLNRHCWRSPIHVFVEIDIGRPGAKRGINLTLKTRIERSHDRINKVRFENPILVKLGKSRYRTSGAVLDGPAIGKMRILTHQ